MNPVIKVENLSKSYFLTQNKQGPYVALRDVLTERAKNVFKKKKQKNKEEFLALKDVSFEVFKGDRIGIIGRNGAGKSTLLKILSRIVAPTKGHLTIEGRVASLLEVGTGFHPELSGRENIFLNGSILGMSRSEIMRKFDEIVSFAEVEKFLDTPVKRYSSGMYVRLAFAVAANLEPEILIVDEVLAVGDARFQRKCLGKMEDVSKNEGRTVLFVSHTLSMVSKLCNKGILLDKGEVICEGNIVSVVDQYEENILSHNHIEDLPDGILYENKVYDSNEFSITAIRFRDKNSVLNGYVRTFDEIDIEIEFYSPYEVENGSVNIYFKTLNDITILRLTTQPDQSVHCNFKKGISSIHCRIPKLVLPHGNYVFSAGLAIPMRLWLYRNDEMFILKVHEMDIFDSGFSPSLDNMMAVSEYTWSNLKQD
jgi:lipopolysaccharide transport system ATP-binding protein